MSGSPFCRTEDRAQSLVLRDGVAPWRLHARTAHAGQFLGLSEGRGIGVPLPCWAGMIAHCG